MLADDKDLSAIQTSDIDSALNKYKSLGGDLITWSSGSAAQQQLESGEAVMALVWSGRGYGAAAAGASNGGNGGSGVVIIRYADTNADLTTIGGTLVKSGGGTTPTTTAGGYKIYVFTGGTGTVTV
jgi:spermidine/putrescine-binding protein